MEDPHFDPNATPPGEEEEGQESAQSRRKFDKSKLEKALRESLKRAVEKGVEAGLETLNRTDKAIRGVVDDVRVPKDLVNYLLSQIDETKNGALRIVTKEIREFLEAADLSGEMRRLLTSLSFEIRTEIRFIPNEAGTSLRPSVKARVQPKNSTSRSDPPEGEENDESDERPSA